MEACPERRRLMTPLVAQALVPAVSRLASTRFAGVTRCRTKSVPRRGDGAGRRAGATDWPEDNSWEPFAQGFGVVVFYGAGHLLGRAGDHDAAAILAAIGP